MNPAPREDVFSVGQTDSYLDQLERITPEQVSTAAVQKRMSQADLATLLSPAAGQMLDELAVRAQQVTTERFGRTIGLYAPIYLSNRCVGRCPYCGFRGDKKTDRITLNMAELQHEAERVAQTGLRHILLVSGEAPRDVTVDYLCDAVQTVRRVVPSVSIEVAPLEEDAYRRLAGVGMDGVTLYQETYDRERYATLHDKGPKSDFDFRLAALSRAGSAGVRKLTVGALWGLAPWRQEALIVGMHAAWLQKHRWRSQISVGLPRLHQVPSDFEIPHPVSDAALVQIIIAMRLFLPDAGLVLSTRERPELRDALAGIGVTQLSAGSRTEPGGYTKPGSAGEQFAVTDDRSPQDVAGRMDDLGFDPVFKDWDQGFHDERQE